MINILLLSKAIPTSLFDLVPTKDDSDFYALSIGNPLGLSDNSTI